MEGRSKAKQPARTSPISAADASDQNWSTGCMQSGDIITLLMEGCRDLIMLAATVVAGAAMAYAQPDSAAAEQAVINKYCVVCHSAKLHTGGLVLQDADLNNVPASAETWEKVIRKLRTSSMPPQGMPRPDAPTVNSLASFLEDIARSRGRGETQSRTRGYAPPESRRVRQCDP